MIATFLHRHFAQFDARVEIVERADDFSKHAYRVRKLNSCEDGVAYDDELILDPNWSDPRPPRPRNGARWLP